MFTHWTCGECGASVALGEEHVCGVSIAEVVALRERIERHAKDFHYLGPLTRVALILCDQELRRKGAE